MSTSDNTWLYAIVPADRQPPADVSGVAGEPLRIVSGSGVAAVAGSVPRAEFDEEPLRHHIEDPAWLERTVRAHHSVIGAIAQTGPLLPVRFATLYRDDQRVAAMLQNQRRELLSTLGQMAGRAEWGVKVYANAGRTITSDEAGVGDGQRPGTAYLLHRKAQQQERSQSLRHAMDEAQQIHAALAMTAVTSTCHALQTWEASGRREPMVLNGAYLIEDAGFTDFQAMIDSLAAGHPELYMEVTGPWPPYSFSSVDAQEQDEVSES
jgi:hypothetical protein